MVTTQRIRNILGAGTLPVQLLPRLRHACDDLGATPTLLTMGRIDLNRATAGESTDFGRGGVRDVSPQPSEIHNAIGHAGSDEIAQLNRDCWERPAHNMVSEIVKAHINAGLVDGETLWMQGLRTGHGLPAEEILRDLKTRIERQFVLVFSTLPDDADKRERLRDGHDLFVRLKDEGIVESTLLTDNASPFARTAPFNLEIQDQFVTRALASLMAAQAHFAKNRGIAEVGRSLGTYAAFGGMAFASRSLMTGDIPVGWRLLRGLLPRIPERGHGSVGNTLLQAKEATRHALTDHHALAIDEVIDLEKPFFVIYTVPISLHDETSWVAFSAEMRRWLANTYPTAVPIFVSGNGAPDPRYSAHYWLQASVIFPMPDTPQPIRLLLGSKGPQRRAPRRARATAHGNGAARDRAAIENSVPIV